MDIHVELNFGSSIFMTTSWVLQDLVPTLKYSSHQYFSLETLVHILCKNVKKVLRSIIYLYWRNIIQNLKIRMFAGLRSRWIIFFATISLNAFTNYITYIFISYSLNACFLSYILLFRSPLGQYSKTTNILSFRGITSYIFIMFILSNCCNIEISRSTFAKNF